MEDKNVRGLKEASPSRSKKDIRTVAPQKT